MPLVFESDGSLSCCGQRVVFCPPYARCTDCNKQYDLREMMQRDPLLFCRVFFKDLTPSQLERLAGEAE